MALQKNFDYKGFRANYWKILMSETHAFRNGTRAQVAVYRDKDIRDLNQEDFIAVIPFDLTGKGLSFAEIYSQLKQMAMFEGSVDC